MRLASPTFCPSSAPWFSLSTSLFSFSFQPIRFIPKVRTVSPASFKIHFVLIGVLVSALCFDAVQYNTVLVFSSLRHWATSTKCQLIQQSTNSPFLYSHATTPTNATNIHPKITASTATSIFTWCGESPPPLAFEFNLELFGFFSLRGTRVRMSE